ncbi:substrate-binding domain-containing protein [Candidatus Latescibacterota bacterium]
MRRHPVVIFIVVALGTFFAAAMPGITADETLLLATTTSTDNTGLLEYLAPLFREDTGIELKWVATGTGQALVLGQNCDVDVLMVHDPASEERFMDNGYGVDRHHIMYNDFVIIGTPDDPAGIRGASIPEVLTRISAHQVRFVSRGDDSGTHMKERSLWPAADLPLPENEKWYIQTGQGMLNTITIAAEMGGYTLTDRGTFIRYESNWNGTPPLVILVEGDQSLRNQYSVIAVNPANCPKTRYDLATVFINWLLSPETQTLIGDFTLLGKQLFIPNALEE